MDVYPCYTMLVWTKRGVRHWEKKNKKKSVETLYLCHVKMVLLVVNYFQRGLYILECGCVEG